MNASKDKSPGDNPLLPWTEKFANSAVYETSHIIRHQDSMETPGTKEPSTTPGSPNVKDASNAVCSNFFHYTNFSVEASREIMNASETEELDAISASTFPKSPSDMALNTLISKASFNNDTNHEIMDKPEAKTLNNIPIVSKSEISKYEVLYESILDTTSKTAPEPTDDAPHLESPDS